MTWPIVFSSLIGCSFILEEAVNPKSAKDSVRYRGRPYPLGRRSQASVKGCSNVRDLSVNAQRRSATSVELILMKKSEYRLEPLRGNTRQLRSEW
jgi:hypothetical protein